MTTYNTKGEPEYTKGRGEAALINLLQKQQDAVEGFVAKTNEKFDSLAYDVLEMQKKAGRPNLGGSSESDTPKSSGWVNAKTAEPILVLKHAQHLAQPNGNTPSVGRFLRGLCLGGQAHDAHELAEERKAMGANEDPSGGYTVSGSLADQWIDNLRANMVLSKAGAITLPMDAGEVAIAKLTADPTCSWHAENAALADASPTFGRLTLKSKTVACLVKFSVELGQDAVNLESQLQGAITKAMANAIDAAGMNGVTTNAAAAPTGIFNLTGRNSVTSIGAPTTWDFLVDGMYELAADNVSMENIGALIAHPAVWRKMRKLKTGISGDNTPLTMPAEVAALPKLWTTAAPLTGGTTASGIIADWSNLIFGVRKTITVKVLSESYMGSNLQLAVLAYARVDFGAARPAAFCTLEGITV